MAAQLLEQLIHALRDTYARFDREGAAAGRAQLRAQRLRLFVAVVVVDGDVAAGGGELARNGAADAAARARHERDPPG